MPIKQLKTISMARVTAADQAIEMPAEKQGAFYSLVESFLLLNPSPSDEHIHQLASAVGMDPETFEQLLYKLFGSVLHPKGGSEPEEILSDNVDEMPPGLEEEMLTDGNEHENLMARLTAGAAGVNPNLFDFDDIDESVTAATTSESGLLDRAYNELASALRGTGESYKGDTLVEHLVSYAEGQPDFHQIFGKGPGAGINARHAAQEFLKKPPFKLESADADGRAAEADGVADPELLGREDPLKEASEGDGAVDEELVQEQMGGGL